MGLKSIRANIRSLIATCCGLALRQINVPFITFKPLEPHSMFFCFVNLIIEHGDEFCHKGGAHFALHDFGTPFELSSSDYYWAKSYLETGGKVDVRKKDGNLYANLQGLTFHIPGLPSVMILNETFLQRIYEIFNVKDKIVVDVGAFIGDTAVYFILNGARRVVAYEPNPFFCRLARENFDLNGCADKIMMIAAAVGAEDGTCKIDSDELGASIYPAIIAKQLSIKSVLAEVGHVYLLKLDCEGAEWDILSKAADECLMNSVDNLIMEVHGFHPERIEKIVRQIGFVYLEWLKLTKGGVSLMLASKSKTPHIAFGSRAPSSKMDGLP